MLQHFVPRKCDSDSKQHQHPDNMDATIRSYQSLKMRLFDDIFEDHMRLAMGLQRQWSLRP
jgi:hypothetical protein